MMEHAGRTLARVTLESDPAEEVTVLAERGGNGGGGLACARHLANRGRLRSVVLDRQPSTFEGAAGDQLGLLERMDVPVEIGDLEAAELPYSHPFGAEFVVDLTVVD